MSELLWTCEQGVIFVSETNELRLVVARAPIGGGYRYQLFRTAIAPEIKVPFASGYREDLRDAIAAAERTAKGFAPWRDARSWAMAELATS